MNPGSWPACCGHLTTLLAVNPQRDELAAIEDVAGPLDDQWWPLFESPSPDVCAATWNAELAAIREGRRVHGGVHVFHCQACGALYGEYSHT